MTRSPLCVISLAAENYQDSLPLDDLSACSQYFYDLQITYSRRSKFKRLRVELPAKAGLDSTGLAALVELAKTGSYRIEDASHLASVIHTAIFAQSNPLLQCCERFARDATNYKDNRSLVTCINVFSQFANVFTKSTADRLFDACAERFTLLKDALVKLSTQSAIHKVLSLDNLQVDTEMEVFDTAMAWLQQHPAATGELPLVCVRYGHMNTDELVDCATAAINTLPSHSADVVLREVKEAEWHHVCARFNRPQLDRLRPTPSRISRVVTLGLGDQAGVKIHAASCSPPSVFDLTTVHSDSDEAGAARRNKCKGNYVK